jgi:hypothetical protein
MRWPDSRDVLALLIVLAALFVWISHLRADAAFRGTVVVTEHDVVYRNLRYFHLTHNGAAVLVMGDRDLPLIQWLATHQNQRVPLTLGSD